MNNKRLKLLNTSLGIFLDHSKFILSHEFFETEKNFLLKDDDELKLLLKNLIEATYLFVQAPISESQLQNLCALFLARVPEIRALIGKDIQAAYERDPSALNAMEIVLCFPGVEAIMMHRIAYALHQLDIPILPRLISRETHRRTSIDIHHAAKIGSDFFIDHGTGVVIGETCIIGNDVTLYHGVTLGAKSFPKGHDDKVVRNLKRHPIIEDGVIIYSNSTILGRVTIGTKSVIGANVTVMEDLRPGSRIYQQKYQQDTFENGMGI